MKKNRIPHLFRALALLSLVALLAAACGDDTDADVSDSGDTGDDGTTDDGDDAGGDETRPGLAGEWLLRSVTVDGTEVTVPAGDIDMRVEQGQIFGSGGCNGFGGKIDAADDGTLTITEMAWTEMACGDPPGVMDFEPTYLELLATVDRWEVTPDELVFGAPTGEIRYELAPPPLHQALQDTVWELDTFFVGAGAERTALNSADMAGVTLVVGLSETTITGPGCTGTVIASEFDGRHEGEFVTGAGGEVPTNAECGIVGEALERLVDSTGFTIDVTRLTFIGAEGEMMSLRALTADL